MMHKKNMLTLALGLCTIIALSGCNDSKQDNSTTQPPIEAEITPTTIELSLLGRYESGVFNESAAEIVAFDAASKRIFTVNAKKGLVDVLDASDLSKPKHIGELSAQAILANTEVNSVAVHNGIVALAVQAPQKTDSGFVAFFKASDLSYISHVTVGALPDMLTFSPDGKHVLVANEGEPEVGYTIDPEGSISIIDITDITKPISYNADFKAFNSQKAALISKGVRIFGPNATVAQDLEPEYITISADSKTAWATLQENNALAKIDIASRTITDIYPLGFKNHGINGQGLDVSDKDDKINITTWSGLYGMYQPDAIASYQVNNQTYLITANEGDAREWISDETAYYAGDVSKGYMEEFRVKHLIHDKGYARRLNDDLPAQLGQLAKGGRLNPDVFGYCGATATSSGQCGDDDQLGRLNVAWNMGYRVDDNGVPVLDSKGYLIYDKLYSFGARSFSIWSANGELVWDSGDQFEQRIAKDYQAYFNSNHEKVAFDDRSDNKGPEPEGITLGQLGEKTFAFIGLERIGGVMVYDISNPKAPTFVQYINTRNFSVAEPDKNLSQAGDLGPEGLTFVSAKNSPNGQPLLLVGNEVSGTTAIFQVNLK